MPSLDPTTTAAVIWVWGLGFRVWGFGFRVWGVGFAVPSNTYPALKPAPKKFHCQVACPDGRSFHGVGRVISCREIVQLVQEIDPGMSLCSLEPRTIAGKHSSRS